MRTKGHIFAVSPHFAGRFRPGALITLADSNKEGSIGSRYNGLTHADLLCAAPERISSAVDPSDVQ